MNMATKNPEKVKLYGLLEMSRDTYIKVQIMVFVCLVIAFIFSLLLVGCRMKGNIFFRVLFQFVMNYIIDSLNLKE